jgi:hypothetical protein
MVSRPRESNDSINPRRICVCAFDRVNPELVDSVEVGKINDSCYDSKFPPVFLGDPLLGNCTDDLCETFVDPGVYRTVSWRDRARSVLSMA